MKQLRRIVPTASIVLASAAAFATETEIARQFPVESRTTTTDTYTVKTATQAKGYPAFVAKPMFWFDCQDTNGWEFASGTYNVMKIPAKSGSTASDRFLEMKNTGGSWNGWSSPMVSPVFTPSDARLGGHPMLDFGKGGSRKALRFNADTDGTNTLRGIGSVVAVWGSQETGGWILGGCSEGLYAWHRGLSRSTASSGTFNNNNPVFHSGAQAGVLVGVVRHNGMPTYGYEVGFNHAWEVVSVKATAANNIAGGIGINDGRSNHYGDSSGMNVAEMMIFDRVLTDAELEALENYLYDKWFDRQPEGWNGNATLARLNHRATSTATMTEDPSMSVIDVPAGETLTVGDLRGGMARARVKKTGAGTIILNGAADFTGEIVLDGGVLRFAPRAIPTFADLSSDVYMRYDATQLGTIETASDDATAVDAWASVGSGTLYGKGIFLRQTSANYRPTLLKDALGAGLNVLDFHNEINDGIVGSDGKYGAYMYITTNRTSASSVKLPPWGFTTVIALMGAHGGGGRALFANDYFVRGGQAGSYGYTTPLLQPNLVVDTTRNIMTSDGRVWVNGVEMNPTNNCYDVSGYQAVAWKVPGGQLRGAALGAYYHANGQFKHSGGIRLGEMFVYDRQLDDEEIRDVQAYLMNRWLGQDAPGYARTASRNPGPDYQNVTVTSPTEVYVAEGATLRIGNLRLSAPLTKTGAGALEIVSCEVTGREGRLVVAGGTSTTVKGPAVTAQCEVAKGAFLHVDATDTASFETLESGGVKYVTRWYGKDFNNALWSYHTARRPWLDTTKTLNGHPMVDFGTFGNSGKCLLMDRGSDSLRTVYAVVDCDGGAGWLLSTDTIGPHKDPDSLAFHPKLDSNSRITALLATYNDTLVLREGETYTNGVPVNPSVVAVTNGVALLEFHAAGGFSASQVCMDRHKGDRCGGYRIGEMIVYERALSEREKVATRNYLMQKWFDAEPQELPEEEPEPTRFVTLTVTGEQTLAGNTEICNLVGSGTLNKTGTGEMKVTDMGGFAGQINVAAGTLALSGGEATATPAFDEEGLLYWAEANSGRATTTAKDNETWVTTWDSKLNDGWTATKRYGTGAIVHDLDFSLKGNDWVDMPKGNALQFQTNGVQARLEGVKSVFWVINSQRGGGFLLGGGGGGGRGLGFAWHRGQYWVDTTTALAGETNLCVLLHSGGAAAAQLAASWRVNGAAVAPTKTHLSGGWDIVSCVVADDDSTVAADGFAFDGRDNRDSGSQGLGEVLLYDRRLSDNERTALENYLACKYGLLHEAATNAAVNVAAGATLDCGSEPQHIGQLTGTGTVTGDVAADALVADGAVTEPLTVNGTFSIVDGLRVRVQDGAATDWTQGKILVRATDFDGIENLATAQLEVPQELAKYALRLKVRNGALMLRSATGTQIIFR